MFVHFLAAAYAEKGDFAKAVELETQVYEKYSKYKPGYSEHLKTDNEMFRQLIDTYKAGKTYAYWEENRPNQKPAENQR